MRLCSKFYLGEKWDTDPGEFFRTRFEAALKLLRNNIVLVSRVHISFPREAGFIKYPSEKLGVSDCVYCSYIEEEQVEIFIFLKVVIVLANRGLPL